MEISNIQKVSEGKYKVTSPECPRCGTTLTVDLDGANLFLYHQGALIHRVFPTLNSGDRERFISGYCPTCWTDLFGDDDEGDDDEYED
jgi:hypothetical protein